VAGNVIPRSRVVLVRLGSTVFGRERPVDDPVRLNCNRSPFPLVLSESHYIYLTLLRLGKVLGILFVCEKQFGPSGIEFDKPEKSLDKQNHLI